MDGNRPSVMILSAAAATGHLRAADALVSAFSIRGLSARHVEVLRYTNPIFRKMSRPSAVIKIFGGEFFLYVPVKPEHTKKWFFAYFAPR